MDVRSRLVKWKEKLKIFSESSTRKYFKIMENRYTMLISV
jgi:hypothetical protein